MSVTDDRQTTDGRAIAHSEREREFTFAKKNQKTTKQKGEDIKQRQQLMTYDTCREQSKNVSLVSTKLTFVRVDLMYRVTLTWSETAHCSTDACETNQ